MLLGEVHAAQQILESRVVAQGVPSRGALDAHHLGLARNCVPEGHPKIAQRFIAGWAGVPMESRRDD